VQPALTRHLAHSLDVAAAALLVAGLFPDPPQGGDAFALALDRRDVLAAAAFPCTLPRSPVYLEQLKQFRRGN